MQGKICPRAYREALARIAVRAVNDPRGGMVYLKGPKVWVQTKPGSC